MVTSIRTEINQSLLDQERFVDAWSSLLVRLLSLNKTETINLVKTMHLIWVPKDFFTSAKKSFNSLLDILNLKVEITLLKDSLDSGSNIKDVSLRLAWERVYFLEKSLALVVKNL